MAEDDGGEPETGAIGRWIAKRRALSADETAVFDPTVFPDAMKAAERIKAAARDGEKIAIFGDYDCDGICSAAMLVRALKRLGASGTAILPHRVRDGYGLKDWVIERCRAAGAGVLIVADNGILSASSVALGNTYGIDTIILDHHHVPDELPQAYAILHPQLSLMSQPYPAAAGVVFLFLHALHGQTWDGRDEDLALAAMGTVADLVPLTGFNRMLTRAGIEAMRHGNIGHISSLIRSCGCNSAVTSTDIAYRLAPRINAAGRMDDPMIALKALLQGGEALLQLETLNADRQKRTTECLDLLHHAPADERPAFLFHADALYPPGIIGLLAGKLTEHWGRPSLVASIQGDTCVASLRSTPAYHITEALQRHAHLLTTYGGHAQAAGCTFPLSNVERLREALERDASAHLSSEAMIPTLELESALDALRIDITTVHDIRTLEPFGNGNPDPLFLARRITLENLRAVGSDGKHLQATLGDKKLIGFGLGPHLHAARGEVDLAFSLGIDAWNGRETPQLMVKDMRAAARN